jgi:hypothetical protein
MKFHPDGSEFSNRIRTNRLRFSVNFQAAKELFVYTRTGEQPSPQANVRITNIGDVALHET